MCTNKQKIYKNIIGPWFPIVGVDHRDWNDLKADELQMWLKDILEWKKLYSNIQYFKKIPYNRHRP
jgi:hypothetical protein